jgi:tetratricopeptide (TPR) repeat protein
MIAVTAVAQKERKYLRQGNSEFEDANYQNSEVSYRKAVDLEENKTHQPAFNVGDALYKQEKYEDAIAQFESIADLDLSKEEKAMIYHNLGNSLLQSNKLKESVDAYKKALKNNPNDLDTKYNLAYAQKKLEQQKKQDQNKDKNEDQDKKDQNQDQQDQDQNKDQQDQNKDKNKQDQQDQKEQQQQQKQQISKEDAERILQAIANDEKKTQQKVKEEKAAATKVKTEKEW